MVRRTNNNTGESFMGCNRFRDVDVRCRYTELYVAPEVITVFDMPVEPLNNPVENGLETFEI